MWAERNQNCQCDDRKGAPHPLVVIPQSINSAVEPVGFYRNAEDRSQDSEEREGVGRFVRPVTPAHHKRDQDSKKTAAIGQPSRAFGFGVFRPLALHPCQILPFGYRARCLRVDSTARGSFAMLFASFAFVEWIMMRGLA